MKFNQKKWGNKSAFELKEDHFIYSSADESSETTFKYKYTDLPTKTDCIHHIEKNILFFFLSFSFFIGGFIQYLVYQFWKDEVRLSLVTIGIVLVIMAFKTRTRFTIFQTERGNILVIKDKEHDAIISQLYSRRSKILLEAYGEIDVTASRSHEISKFEWLFEQEVINESQLKDKKMIIETMHNTEQNAEKEVH
ncbi:MAG: hypothetical protein MJK04_14565 [Psychrosphaera sp.]|nr:hypothetical protein [Psychrosphaera sp.]